MKLGCILEQLCINSVEYPEVFCEAKKKRQGQINCHLTVYKDTKATFQQQKKYIRESTGYIGAFYIKMDKILKFTQQNHLSSGQF